MYRIGFSEDIHQIKKGRKLFLGGVFLENVDGLDGHSDADVVLHAVGESILGALALGDLGKHFPDTDSQYKDISSSVLVKHIVSLMKEKGFEINNIDIQVGCSTVKLANHIEEMRNNKVMRCNCVGPIGEGKAIKASSIVLLKRD